MESLYKIFLKYILYLLHRQLLLLSQKTGRVIILADIRRLTPQYNVEKLSKL